MRTVLVIVRSGDMKAKVELPKAFSVRDDHEFLPIAGFDFVHNVLTQAANVSVGQFEETK